MVDSADLKVEVIPDDYSQYDLSFKIIVIGDSGVGKRVYGGKGLLEIGKDVFKGSGIDYSVLLPPISTLLGL